MKTAVLLLVLSSQALDLGAEIRLLTKLRERRLRIAFPLQGHWAMCALLCGTFEDTREGWLGRHTRFTERGSEDAVGTLNDEVAKIRRHARSSVNAANVLCEVFLACEPRSGAALAVGERAVEGLLSSTMHLVHFALVAQEPAAVGEALQLLAALDVAFVGTVVLVHVFTPLALSIECKTGAVIVLAYHLSLCIPWRLFGPFVGMVLPAGRADIVTEVRNRGAIL